LIKITRKQELIAFEKIFLEFLEFPSMRWKVKKLIKKYDECDFAELDVKLLKLNLEIEERKKKE